MKTLNPLSWFRGKADSIVKDSAKPGSHDFAREMLAQSWEAFKLARRDRPHDSNQPFAFSGDSAIRSSHELMNRRVRDLVRNTAHGKRIKSAFQDLVVGSGFQTFSWPFAPHELFQIITELETLQGGDLGPRLHFALESDDLFQKWSDDPESFDIEGRLTRTDMERMAMGEVCTTGNALIIRNFRKGNGIVPLCYQIIEREQLDESMDRPAGNGDNKIVGGIEFDRNNRAVAYHIYSDHPHDAFSGNGTNLQGLGGISPTSMGENRLRIPADRVIDLCLWDRPSSSMGASWFDATGQTTWDRDSCVDSEIKSAALDASFAFAAYLKDADKYGGWGFSDGTDDSDDFGNRQFKLGHSPIATVMSPEEKLEMVRSTRPNKDMPVFMKMLDRDAASGHSLSYYTLTGDYESTSFTSTRGSKLDEDLHVKPLQRWFGLRVSLRIRREFNAVAAASGAFKTLSASQFLADRDTYQRFDAIGNGRDLLDPYKEGEARISRLRTGLSTYKEECAKSGEHWIRRLMQIAIEQKVTELFGVSLDFSKAGAGRNGDQQANAIEQLAKQMALLNGD